MEVLFFEERKKPEYPEKKLSEQRGEPTTNSTHIWRPRRVSNPVGGECSHQYRGFAIVNLRKCAIPKRYVYVKFANLK